MSDNSLVGSVTRQLRERTVLRNVYLWMTGGLALTAVVALGVAGNPAVLKALFARPLNFFIVAGMEIALVMWLSARIMTMSATLATTLFAAYSALNGLTIGAVVFAYTQASVASAFFISAATFAGVSVWGLVTKRNLSGVGHYLGMAVWGILVAMIVNLLLRSSALDFIISLVGVGVFVGLTAYDTQRIAAMSRETGSAGEQDFVRLSILGALKLYLDFINVFLFVLRLFGRRR